LRDSAKKKEADNASAKEEERIHVVDGPRGAKEYKKSKPYQDLHEGIEEFPQIAQSGGFVVRSYTRDQ
jgi:hypothetical protein